MKWFILIQILLVFLSQHPEIILAQVKQDSLNPEIKNVINAISSDSTQENIRHLQQYGSRYKLLENRREIAGWIAGKLKSYGIESVTIDSFYCHIVRPVDTTLWQFNVEGQIVGSNAPDEEYVLGAHYDSYSNVNVMTNAPGADDNASGVAALLEISRAMIQAGYIPESTLTFAFFSAEEMGGQGSEYMAKTASQTGRDIRLMLNLDMIANDPDTLGEIDIYQFFRVESAGKLAKKTFEKYTDLKVHVPVDSTNNESDSYFFWFYGFPVTFCIEHDFSPNWHNTTDTLEGCNINFCAGVAQGAIATVMEDQLLPYPRSVIAHSTPADISLSWSPTKNSRVSGYSVYRSSHPDTGFVRLNVSQVTDPPYVDQTAVQGNCYYYYITTVGTFQEESMASDIVYGFRIAFSDTLLVVNSVPDYSSTPAEDYNYYSILLDTVPFVWHDVNKQKPLSPELLARHRDIWWMSNTHDYSPGLFPEKQALSDFFKYGGNLLLTAFIPSKLIDGLTANYNKVGDSSVLRTYFKADSANRKPISIFYRGLPAIEGFDTLNVDPAKEFSPGLPGELQNIEVYTADSGGTVLYRFDSHYSSGSPLGALKDKPVGLGYFGMGYKTILLSFPLLYIDSTEAKPFIHAILRNVFSHPTGFGELASSGPLEKITLFPNPCTKATTIHIKLSQPVWIQLKIYPVNGFCKKTINLGQQEAGEFTVNLTTEDLQAGVYIVTVKTPTQLLSERLLVVQ